jgi:asparagine synthase (glutamine-hydrolysing)
MCGIVGYWDKQGASINIATKMANIIRHRGPDGSGTWIDKSKNLVLAHRRLSIIDLTEAGHQPMVSPCNRFVLTFNGEIYNHLELRIELEREGGNFNWRGSSDTETLLAALRCWGLEKTLKKLNGMFAFALWDNVERILFLARDRMGEKPLYYGHNGDTFLFGSELKSFKAHPKWQGVINRDALTLYMRHNYVPAPWSIYRGINKLPPAHFVVIKNGGSEISKPQCYWNLAKIAEKGSTNLKQNAEQSIDELDVLLRDAVKGRMAADVPLGAFLSGGFDSTLVAALMQSQSNKPIKTFTIGFHEKGYNEAVHAKAVAKHLGTDHTELYVTPQEAIAVIPKLASIWDEPFADSSQIPTLLVSELARKHVTVSLSGDGGDELFCGYNRYTQGYQVWNKLRLLPAPMRNILANTINILPGHVLESMQKILPKRLQVAHLVDRLPKLADVIRQGDGDSYYYHLISHWKNPEEIVINGKEPLTLFNNSKNTPKLPGLRERMMYLDSMTYLPDDILTKVDRASMAVSLEARVPLLDHRVVEFAWQLPMSMKYKDGQSKWALREVLYRYVPRKLMERPKMGFGVPIDEWLRGPLREWGEELLSEKRLREEGFFDPVPIRQMWQEHVSGKRRWHYQLWDVLMFQAWLDEQ